MERVGMPKISNNVIHSKERDIISTAIERCDENNVLLLPTQQMFLEQVYHCFPLSISGIFMFLEETFQEK
jgi:hypothetical protein